MQTLRSTTHKLEDVLEEYSNACALLARTAGHNYDLHSLQPLRDDLDGGLRMLSAVEARARQLMITLGKTRNLICAPINFLPNEIIARVFHFMASAHSACFEQLVDNGEPPVDILAASQVCSRWRQIALSSHTLWTHINLSSHHGTEYISLGRICSARSGYLPLSIRGVEQDDITERWDKARLDAFFNEIGLQLESIELALFPPVFILLKSSLTSCIPGRLTRLVISDRNIYLEEELPDEYFDSSDYWFLVHYNAPPSSFHNPGSRQRPNPLRLSVTQERLENLLLPVKVLRLDRVYPAWTSKAYHGLVELRLIGPPQLTRIITEQSFAAILVASPKLRVLHFGLEFISTRTRPDPIQLEELEEFQLQSVLYATQHAILRLILPGSKPLLMCTMYDKRNGRYLPPLVEDELCHFFKRSNVAQLQVLSDFLSVRLPNLLKLLPHLQTLIFRLFRLEPLALSPHESLAVRLCPSLRDLHFISCGINLKTLQWLASTHELRKVVIWEGTIREVNENRSINDIQDFPIELHPIVQVLNGRNDTIKIEGWGEDLEDRVITASLKKYKTY